MNDRKDLMIINYNKNEINLNNFISEKTNISQYENIGLESIKVQDDFEYISNTNILKNLCTLDNNNETDANINYVNKKVNSETQTDNFNIKTDNLYNFNESQINELKIKIELLEKEKNILQLQNIKLTNNNTRLVNSFNEVSKLLVNFTKININTPEIDDIKAKLTVLVNRELRMKCPFPFINILSKFK